MFQNKNIQKHLVMTIGGVIGVIGIGAIITIAALNTAQEIPDSEPGTIGYALSGIIHGDWQNSSLVKQSKQLGGVNGEQFLRMTSTYGCSSDKVLARISPDGIQIGSDCVSLPPLVKRPRPILATIRDLDSSCYTGNNVKISNPGYSSGGTTIPSRNFNPTSSDPIDLYEDDKIETTDKCLLASLYMPDNSIIRLSASTTITLRYAGIPGGSGATSTDLNGGEMWARVLKPITDDSYFNVNTQEASVGVRGTSVWIKRDGGKTIALPIDSGKLTPDNISKNVGAIVVYPKRGELTALGTPVPLTHTITVNEDGTSTLAPYRTSASELNFYSASTTAQIYNDKPFVRIATLADIMDFKAFSGSNLGNLATIRTTRSEFNLRGGEHMKWKQASVIASDDQIQTNSTLTQEFSRTLPSDENEKSTLCLGGDSNGTSAPSLKQWWDAVPLGRTNCIDIGTGFLADYSKNDSNLYGSGLQIGMQNMGSASAINGGIKIENIGEYIKYDADRTNIPNSTITIQLAGNVGPDGYVFDFGGNIKLRKQSGNWKCMWTGGPLYICPGTIYNSIEQKITITVPLKTNNTQYTQLIFGNIKLINLANGQITYPGPIGTTIQSISISNPVSTGGG